LILDDHAFVLNLFSKRLFLFFRVRLLSLPHGIQTILHIIQMTMSYSLMLVAMTFNTYLFFAVILGSGFGHFLFGWRRSSVIDHNEHCH
jgi:copper transporter 1